MAAKKNYFLLLILFTSSLKNVCGQKCFSLWFNKCRENSECCSDYCEKQPYHNYGFCSPNVSPVTTVRSNNFSFREPISDYTVSSTQRPAQNTLSRFCQQNGFEECKSNEACCSNYCEKESYWEYGTCKPSPTTISKPSVRVVPVRPQPVLSKPSKRNHCGIRGEEITDLKVSGGQKAQEGEYPWMASLNVKLDSGFSHFCGGAIVDKRFILTAAHCFKGKTAEKVSVVTNVSDLRDTENRIKHDVDKIIMHPLYKFNKNDNDIALLRLKREIRPFTSTQFPICLPEPEEEIHGNVEIAGWGHTVDGGISQNELKRAETSLVSRRKCSEYLGEITLTFNMICAGGDGVVDTCKGDSGGPLMQEFDGNYFVYGVVSFGKGCAKYSIPGVYTKVTKYIDWINKEVEKG